VRAGLPREEKTPGLEMKKYRQFLPIFQKRTEILKKIRDNQFTVIKGGTGGGKTTQVTLLHFIIYINHGIVYLK
jgi:HrpA-like RNA helicase